LTAPIVHVVAGLGRSQGGPSYSIPRLCAAQREAGAEIRLCAVESPGDEPLTDVEAELWRHDYANVPVVGKLRASRSLRSHLESVVPAAAVVHVHGIWLMPNVDAGIVAGRNNRPLVVSPRGMLAPEALRISRNRKRLFWKFLQEAAYAKAAVWHATCEAEADEIRNFGVRAPVAVIPNGVDIPSVAGPRRQAPHAAPRCKTLLFLGRVHPKKALPLLVQAWAQVSGEFNDWRLRIVGPDENGHAAELKALIKKLGVERISIEPPLFEALKAEALSDASIFILPTLNENFGVAVAEALAAGTPAIVTKGAPWSGLVTEDCGWWVDHGLAPLASAMRAAMRTTPAELQAMGDRGRAWVARDFTWTRVATDMLAVYDWLGHGGPAPATVRLN
jgi:glycosyltransferase involved in cell wall biosynthesis